MSSMREKLAAQYDISNSDIRYDKKTQKVTHAGSTTSAKEKLRNEFAPDSYTSRIDSLRSWADRYSKTMKGIQDYTKQRNFGYTTDVSGGYSADIDSLISDFAAISDYADRMGLPNARRYLKQLKDLQSEIQKENDLIAGLSEDEYNRRYRDPALWQEKYSGKDYAQLATALKELDDGSEKDWLSNYAAYVDEQELINLDLSSEQKTIDILKKHFEDYDFLSRYMTDAVGQKRLDQYRNEYGSVSDLEKRISQEERRVSRAKRLQAAQKLASVADPNAENYDPYFQTLSTYLETGADGTEDSLYEWINDQAGYREQYELAKARNNALSGMPQLSEYTQNSYDKMTDSEISTYNYWYAKEGPQRAMEYLNSIQDTLNARTGLEAAETLKGHTGLEMVFGLTAGIDQFKSGLMGTAKSIAGDDSYAAPSAIQYASGKVREDLAETGPKLPAWLGGASLGQIGYDAVTTAANMAPSILGASLSNLVLPGSGTVVGSAMMGASAAGSAYQEALNEGYTLDQARGYGLLSGASEIVMEKLLGGISAYGGNALGKFFTQNMKNADTALKRIAKELGGSMLSEFSEEYLQEVLTPVFQNLTLGTDEEVKLVSAEALYAGFLGAITGGIMEGPTAIVDARNATQVPGNATVKEPLATELANNATPEFRNATESTEKSTPEKSSAVGFVSKMETVQMTEDLDSFAKQFGKQAKAVERNYLEGQNLQEYEIGFQTAFALGLNGKKQESLSNEDLPGLRHLQQSQREIAYQLGAEAAAAQEAVPATVTEADVEAGIQEAQHYGRMGYSLEQLKQHGTDAAVLTESQQLEAWEAGRQIHLQKAEAAPGAGTKVTGKTAGVWFDAGGGNPRAFDEVDTSGLSDTALAGANTAKVLQKLGIGKNYYFYESYVNDKGDRVYKDAQGVERIAPNGWYDPDGSIHIDLNAGAEGKGLTMYTLSHELTHFVEKWSPKKYQAMTDFLVANYAKAGNVDAMVAEKQAELSAGRGTEVSYEEAYSEFIADSMEAMLSDGNVLEKLQELKKADKSLFDKIKEFFDNLAKKIREIYKDLTPDSLEGQAVLQMKDQIEQIQQLFAEGLAEASENLQAAAETGLEVDMNTESVSPAVMYQDRSTGTSNRALLAGAFEELVTSPDELKFLRDYQENIGLLNEQEAKLQDIRTEIRELTFGKGSKDPQRLAQLQEEAGKTANRIHIYDKKLLQLERAKPLRDVLDREREKVRKATRQKGQEVLENYREKRKESAAKKDARRKIRKTIMDLNKLLNRGDKKKNVKEGMTAMVGKSLKLAEALFMDEYSNRDMLRNGFSTTLTDTEEAAFRDAQQLLERIESGAALEGMEFRSEIEAQDYLKKLDGKLSGKMSKLKDAFARERKMMYGTTVSDLLGQLADEYNRLSEDEDGAVRAAKDENVYAHLLQLKKDVGGTTVRDMTLGQMEQVADAFTMVLTTVRNANKLFAKNLNFKRDTLAAMVMGEIRSAAKKKGILEKPWEHAKDSFFWNNLKPVYAFSRLGSETLRTLYQNIRKGQDSWAIDMQEADAFRRDQYRKHGWKKWDTEKLHSFEFESGKVELNLGQIMSLYAYSRRESAQDHLLKGGFVFEPGTEVVIKDEHGIKHKYIRRDATAYNLSADELMQVVNTLNVEQKAFVEEMQTYLSDVMGGKGNEVSIQMYGIKSFGEKNYFPIRSAGQYMEKAKEKGFMEEQGQISIVNSGFTKATTPHASNPIVLGTFMDVWAKHVNDMAMYHGLALPMEDFRRVYHYNSPYAEKERSKSVDAAIENAFGIAATAYIDQLYKDLNGGAVSDNRENLSKKLVGLHKKAAVFASASVVIQQPSAIVRAFAVVDPKHFIGSKVDHKRHNLLWEEVKKYAPVAFVKEMGYFDTGMGRSAKDYLQAEEYTGIREKVQALFKDGDYRDEILGKAPALADELTWCSIWEAVKRETKAKNPGMNAKSDAFLQIAGDRFAEVIDKTQVYDSVLSRSANMRSKALHMNMLTSFMAEPTTSINMLEDALRRGDRKQLKRTVGAVYGSVLLNSMLVSLVYAARDDDEDETYWEKYLSSVAVEMVDGINPITYYPFLRDIWSIGQGFDVERADMSLITDFATAAKKVISAGMELRDADEDEEAAAMAAFKDSLWSMTDSVASLTGLPVKNIRRDIEGARNLVKTISADWNTRDTTRMSLMDTVLGDVMSSIPIGNLLYSKNKRDRLYDAMIAGDTSYVDRLKAGYETENAYHSAIKMALRENDSRIWEAAVAWNDDELDTYADIAEEIVAEGYFSKDTVIEAIRAEAAAIEESDAEPSQNKSKSYYTNEQFGIAAAQGNMAMTDRIKEDLIDTALKNGKSQKEAEADFESAAKTQLKKQYMEDNLQADPAEDLLQKYAGFNEEDAASYMTEWEFEKENGFSYSNRKSAYLNGLVSAEDLKEMMIQRGMDEEDAEAQILSYDWSEEGYVLSASRVIAYQDHLNGIITRDDWQRIVDYSSSQKNDVDENGNTITYSAARRTAKMIEDMYPGRSQAAIAKKQAVYNALGWSKSTVKKVKTW